MHDGNTKTISGSNGFLSEAWPEGRQDRWSEAHGCTLGGGKKRTGAKSCRSKRGKEVKHYVYRLENPATGEFYFGCRTARRVNPQEDIRYLGSGIWPREMKRQHIKLSKTIVRVYRDLAVARRHEKLAIKRHRHNLLCKNRCHHSPFLYHWRYKTPEIHFWMAQDEVAKTSHFKKRLVFDRIAKKK